MSDVAVERLIESYWRGALRWADVMRIVREKVPPRRVWRNNELIFERRSGS